MPALGLKIIDQTVHTTNLWINELDSRVGWDHPQRSYRLLRAVLHALRDHLSVDEAVQLGAQMPTLIRGIYYDGWNPSKGPVKMRSAADFTGAVQKEFETDPLGDADIAIRSVIWLLRQHISEGEMDQVEQVFTTDIRTLFD